MTRKIGACAVLTLLAGCIAVGPALAALQLPAGSTLDVADGRIDFGGADLQLAGALLLGNGELLNVDDVQVLATGSLQLGSGLLRMSGDWRMSGQMDAGSSSVEMRDGPAESRILGNSTFAVLDLQSSTGKRYLFESGLVQQIDGLLRIRGDGAPIVVAASSPGATAMLDLADGGAQDIDNVAVFDVHAIGQPLAPEQTNQGGNDNDDGWFGNGGLPVPPLPPQPQVVPAASTTALLGLGLLLVLFAGRHLCGPLTSRGN